MSVEPYDGDQPALYVSYAREDWDVVAPEVEALQRLGLRVWFPPDDSDELGDAAGRLKAAPFVLVFVTPDALESEPVRQEVSLTLQESKDALAVHLVETPMQGPNGLLLGRLQTVNKYRMSDDLYKRRIAKSAPGAVKSREILFEDAPQAPPPSRSRGQGAGGGPLEGVDPKVLWGGAIGGVVLLLALLGMVLLGGDPAPAPSAGEGTSAAAPGETSADAAEAERIREERIRKEREALAARRKEREEAERQAEVRRSARDKTAAAQRLLDAGEYEQAIAAFGEALELDPAQVAALSGRGRARSLSGDDEGALVDLERAVELASKAAEDGPVSLTDALMERAAIRAALDDYAGAIADYSAVIERAPRSYAYAKRGDCKRRQGDHEGAVADYDKAIELDPKAAAVYYSRGLARKALGDTQGAADDMAKARELQTR